MKCITSFRQIKKFKKYKDYSSFRISERNKFLSQKNLGVNLEFRAVHDNVGFNFHDRFLFFIPKEVDEIPRVYSLGTSINGLGNSHHLVMQASNPRNIVSVFQELWQILENNEDSLIIRLPERK
jgi:hypothetical protein